MANYWRRFFDVDEIPDDQQGPDDNTDPEMMVAYARSFRAWG